MKTSESIKNLSKALLSAQTQMGAAVKGSKNPFFKSSYADLPTVMEVVKGPLNDAGIVILQPTSHRDSKNFILTVLIHAESGEMLVGETEVICAKQNDPQAFGAAQTYARRFGLQSMGFIPAEDDDGNFASGKTNKAEVQKTPPLYAQQGKVEPIATQQTAASAPQVVSEYIPGAGTLNLKQSGLVEPTPSQVSAASAPTVTTQAGLQPLKKSSFRKDKPVAPKVVPDTIGNELEEPKW